MKLDKAHLRAGSGCAAAPGSEDVAVGDLPGVLGLDRKTVQRLARDTSVIQDVPSAAEGTVALS